jgi:hypothetical protein
MVILSMIVTAAVIAVAAMVLIVFPLYSLGTVFVDIFKN